MNFDQTTRHEKIFDLFSQSQTKTVEIADLEKLLLMAGHTVISSEVKTIINSFDKDKITLDEFLKISKKLYRTDIMKDDLKRAFLVLDPEDTGYIPLQQLIDILKEGENKLTPSEVDELVEILEPDVNGKVNYGALIKGLYDTVSVNDNLGSGHN